jgi:hypothetical protein
MTDYSEEGLRLQYILKLHKQVKYTKKKSTPPKFTLKATREQLRTKLTGKGLGLAVPIADRS